jgi:hypothetical protein
MFLFRPARNRPVLYLNISHGIFDMHRRFHNQKSHRMHGSLSGLQVCRRYAHKTVRLWIRNDVRNSCIEHIRGQLLSLCVRVRAREVSHL